MPASSSLFANLRSAFLTGLLLLSPLAVTVLVFKWLLQQVGGSFRGFFFFWVPNAWLGNPHLALLWDLLATVIVLGLVTLLGVFSRWVLGRYFGGIAERFIEGIPGVGGVYQTVKQIVQTFGGENRAAFSKVVLVRFPHPGCHAVAFLTNTSGGEASRRTGEDLVSVFVPTTPNPTGGYLLLFPRRDVIELEMTVKEGMKYVISGGSVLPPGPGAAPVPVHNPAA